MTKLSLENCKILNLSTLGKTKFSISCRSLKNVCFTGMKLGNSIKVLLNMKAFNKVQNFKLIDCTISDLDGLIYEAEVNLNNAKIIEFITWDIKENESENLLELAKICQNFKLILPKRYCLIIIYLGQVKEAISIIYFRKSLISKLKA